MRIKISFPRADNTNFAHPEQLQRASPVNLLIFPRHRFFFCRATSSPCRLQATMSSEDGRSFEGKLCSRSAIQFTQIGGSSRIVRLMFFVFLDLNNNKFVLSWHDGRHDRFFSLSAFICNYRRANEIIITIIDVSLELGYPFPACWVVVHNCCVSPLFLLRPCPMRSYVSASIGDEVLLRSAYCIVFQSSVSTSPSLSLAHNLSFDSVRFWSLLLRHDKPLFSHERSA